MTHQIASHTNPSAPVAMNAAGHPQRSVISGNDERCHERADVGSGVEEAGSKRALAFRKPFGHDLDCGGKVTRFAEAECESRNDEAGDRRRVRQAGECEDGCRRSSEEPDAGVRHRGKAPDDDGDRESLARTKSVDDPAGDEQADAVGELKREHDVAVVDLRPAELTLQRRLQDADHLAIDVVDGGGEEEKRADDPAEPADTRRCGDGRHVAGALTRGHINHGHAPRGAARVAFGAPARSQIVGLRR